MPEVPVGIWFAPLYQVIGLYFALVYSPEQSQRALHEGAAIGRTLGLANNSMPAGAGRDSHRPQSHASQIDTAT